MNKLILAAIVAFSGAVFADNHAEKKDATTTAAPADAAHGGHAAEGKDHAAADHAAQADKKAAKGAKKGK